MNVKKWKIGFAVAILSGLLCAGAGLGDGMSWMSFIRVLCAALLTNLGCYLMKHPVESIVEDSTSSSKSVSPDGSTKQVDFAVHKETPVPGPTDLTKL